MQELPAGTCAYDFMIVLLLLAQDLAAARSFARSLTEQGFARSEVSCSGSLRPGRRQRFKASFLDQSVP